jgi:hypothetical protein
MLALHATAPGSATENIVVVRDAPKPQISKPHDILVRVHAVALNPADWKMVKYNFLVDKWPVLLGCACLLSASHKASLTCNISFSSVPHSRTLVVFRLLQFF